MSEPPTAPSADLHFYFDPVCPFAWLTSRWIHEVKAQRSYTVEWRFVSLRQMNAHIDYDAHFPPEYEAGHNAGLRMLRVCASVRDEHGPDAMEDLYTALGTDIFDTPRADDPSARDELGREDHVGPILERAGLPATHLAALDDDGRWDPVVQADTDEALSLTGKDVGTPIIHFEPPHGTAFFGPVISRLPRGEEAVELWDHVIGLARFGGFAEIKRSLRERPRLRAFGLSEDDVAVEEDWHGGSRRQKR